MDILFDRKQGVGVLGCINRVPVMMGQRGREEDPPPLQAAACRVVAQLEPASHDFRQVARIVSPGLLTVK